jgi:hypothetical protein
MADDQPTCGKGLAANAILPERLAALMNAMATMLENHTRALDPSEANGRLERDAYERLVRDQRALASGLEAVARAMESYRDLPMAKHDMSPLRDRTSRAVLSVFIAAERDLIALLQKQAAEYEGMLGPMAD